MAVTCCAGIVHFNFTRASCPCVVRAARSSCDYRHFKIIVLSDVLTIRTCFHSGYLVNRCVSLCVFAQIAELNERLSVSCNEQLCVNQSSCVLPRLVAQYSRQATYLRDQFLAKQAMLMLPRLQTTFAFALLALWLLSVFVPFFRHSAVVQSVISALKAGLALAVAISLPLFDTVVLTFCAGSGSCDGRELLSSLRVSLDRLLLLLVQGEAMVWRSVLTASTAVTEGVGGVKATVSATVSAWWATVSSAAAAVYAYVADVAARAAAGDFVNLVQGAEGPEWSMDGELTAIVAGVVVAVYLLLRLVVCRRRKARVGVTYYQRNAAANVS